MNLYKKCIAKPYSFLVIDTTLASDNSLFQKKSLYFPLGKAFEKQIKPIEDQGQKQIKELEDNKKQLANTNADELLKLNYINI